MILLDVGVWLAAVWGRHAHHPATADWFGRQTGDLVFCRVTQMSLLRLLSNPAIMGGDAVDRSQAWRTCDQLWADERVLWATSLLSPSPATPRWQPWTRSSPPATRRYASNPCSPDRVRSHLGGWDFR